MAELPMECEVWSPCKINPTLEVLGRRADGMHEVVTTLLALDLCDRVRVRRYRSELDSVELRLTCSGPAHSADIPMDARNLAWRGAQVVLDLAAQRGMDLAGLGVELQIEKHVPSQAGLGGGSSNAAAAAYGLTRLLGLDCDDPELHTRLGLLGADVAFFLAARRSGWGLCRGRGERVQALELPAMDERVFVIWTPRATCSTGAVYAALRPEEMHAKVRTERFNTCLSAPLEEARAACINDLEAAAGRVHSELNELRGALESMGPGVAGLCGSGSSFFGMFNSHEEAQGFLLKAGIKRIERDFGLRAQFIARARGAGVG